MGGGGGGKVYYEKDSEFSAYALMLEEKYQSFPLSDRKIIESNKKIDIKKVEIRSPNNPANYLGARLISFKK